MELVIEFVTAVVVGKKQDDLVVFGPAVTINGKSITLQAWVPKTKRARKGAKVTGLPTIGVREDAKLITTYTTKEGETKAYANPRLTVVLGGEYEFEFSEAKVVSLSEFFNS
jgi:hypothetical protein